MFRKYWPDCQLPIYWISNTKPVPEGATPIYCNPDKQYCRNIIDSLHQLEGIILLWSDESFLLGPIDNTLMDLAIKTISDDPSIASIIVGHYYFAIPKARIVKDIKPCDTPHYSDSFATIPESLQGSVSTQPALWNTNSLIKTLSKVEHIANESPYYAPLRHAGSLYTTAMEQKGSEALRETCPNQICLRPCTKIVSEYSENALLYGNWIGMVHDRLKAEGALV